MSAGERAERAEFSARQLREELMATLKRSGSLDAVKVGLPSVSASPTRSRLSRRHNCAPSWWSSFARAGRAHRVSP